MTDAQREAQRRYRQRHPEKVLENRKRYREKNKEKLLAYQRKKRLENPEKYREMAKRHYEKNKETMLAKSKEYTRQHRAHITKLLNKRRKEVAIELASKGQIYTYLNKSARESKMIIALSKKLNITEDYAKVMLVDNDWNYKKLTENYKNASEI